MAATALGGLLLSPTLASAQENRDPAAIEEVVVTARRVIESAQDVPVSLTAVSSEAIKGLAATDISNIQKVAPGIFFQAANGNPSGFWVAIRGQVQGDVLLSQDASVGFYTDGVYIPRTTGLKSAFVDIDRVEVLRGPQGTLYGRNTTGGAVATYTRQPTNELGGYARVRLGDYKDQDFLGVVNIPLPGLGGGLRLVGNKDDRKGFGHDGLGNQLSDNHTEYLRASLLLKPTEELTVSVTGDMTWIRNGDNITKLGGLLPANAPANILGVPGGFATLEALFELGLNPAAPSSFATTLAAINARNTRPGGYDNNQLIRGYDRNRVGGVGATMTYEINDNLTLKSISGYRYLRSDRVSGYDGTGFVWLNSNIKQHDDFYSQEVQLLGNYDRLNWVAGGYYSREKGNEFSSANAIPLLNPNNPSISSDGDVVNKNLSAYGQANYELTPSLTLTGGLRYTHENRSMVSHNRDQFTCLATGAPLAAPLFSDAARNACSRSFSNKFNNVSWLGSVDYKISPDVLVYAKISRGFVSGGQNVRGSFAQPLSYEPFQPEKATQYEVGEKADLFDRRVRLNTSIFYTDYQDIQRLITLPGGVTQAVTNAASGKIYGGEVEGQVVVLEGLRLNGSAAYTKGKYDRFVDLTGDRTDEPFPFPKWTYSIGATYAVPTELGEARANVNWRWQSKVALQPFAFSRDQITQKGYGLLDARVALDVKAINAELAVYGRNLTNKYYRKSAIALDTQLGFNSIFIGDPKTYGVELTWRFGGER